MILTLGGRKFHLDKISGELAEAALAAVPAGADDTVRNAALVAAAAAWRAPQPGAAPGEEPATLDHHKDPAAWAKVATEWLIKNCKAEELGAAAKLVV